jgi:prepilin-type N-terminal cleavage/methylation domain-containing protein
MVEEINMKKIGSKSGFTLIELLVVMVIIAILATLGIVAYTNSLRNARNSKRISDLNSLAAAYEQELTSTGNYPASCTAPTSILGGMPRDPATNLQYSALTDSTNPVGLASCTTTAFCLCIALESSSEGNSTDRACTSITSDNTANKDFFCVRNKQ